MEQNWDHFHVEDVYKFTKLALQTNGYPIEAAKSVAFALVEADKRGIFSHGVTGATGLPEAISRKGILANVDPSSSPIFCDEKYPTIRVINANGSPGPLSSTLAIDHLKINTRKYGLAKVVVNNANHFGAAGIWSEKIAEERDLIGIVSCTTAACVKPLGDDPEKLDYTKGAGNEIRTGTNPIAISVPYKGGIITLDMALTRLAISYSIQAFNKGSLVKIPEYIADKNYQSTLDPKDLINPTGLIGSVFPLGSSLAGYKGDSLLKMIELVHSFGGGPIRKVKTTSSNPDERVSHTFEAQAVDYQYSKQEALERVTNLIRDYELNYFGPASRWPGDRSNQALEYVLKEGLPYSQDQVELLRRISAYSGLEFDSLLQSISRKPIPANIFIK
ncbi:MAG: Ldh family oxidoreductase [Promethearchaeota archaeon]